MNLFGQAKKPEDPADQVKEWKRSIVREQRVMERDIQKIKKEEQKALMECKKLAKANQVSAAKIIAKQIVSTRKTIDRMTGMKLQLHSVELQLQSTLSMLKIQGCLSKSTEIMVTVNRLMRIPDMSKTMGDMAREMERAGLIEEVMSDTMGMLDPEDIDDAADMEIDRIVAEALAGVLTSASAPRTDIRRSASGTKEEKEEEVEDMSEMRSRLSVLK